MAVRLAAFQRARAELELVTAIEAALAAGASWQAVGGAIGTSGETARQRYSGPQATSSHASFLRSVAEEAFAAALARAETPPKGIRPF
jgi:hypothetical protein